MSLASAPAGFRELYREHYTFVWYTVRRFGVPSMSLEDAVQDTFVAAFRKRNDFDGASPRAWLYSIGRRVASNHRRGFDRAQRRHQATTASPAPRSTEDLLLAKSVVEAFLATQQVQDRELFVLSEIDGLTGPELSQLLQKDLTKIYGRLRVLRNRFAPFVAERDTRAAEALDDARNARPTSSVAGWLAVLPHLQLTPAAITGASGWLGLSTLGYVAGGALGAIALVGVALPPAHETSLPPNSSSRPHNVHVATVVTHDAKPETLDHRLPPTRTVPRPGVAAVPASRPSTTSNANRTHRTNTDREDALAVPPDLAGDTALLRNATLSLREGKPELALQQLDEHASRFGPSHQADLRAVLRVEALCTLGRTPAAKATADALLAGHPTTPTAARIRRTCAGQR